MSTFVYRFRPVNALLDRYQELERQEVYFAPPAELNDPYDGAVEVQWIGDQILWTNLLNHYLLCLTHAVILTQLKPESADWIRDNLILGSEADLETPSAKALYYSVRDRFWAQSGTKRIPEQLAARKDPIGRNELRMHIRTLHGSAVQLVLALINRRYPESPLNSTGNDNSLGKASSLCNQMIEAINLTADTIDPHNLGGLFGEISETYHYQESILNALDGGSPLADLPGVLALMVDFPTRYVTKLETLLYSDWYTACFVEEATNAAMWGIYGDSHRGVALKFRTQDVQGKPALVLNGKIGFSGGVGGPSEDIRADRPYVLESVRYACKLAPLDFFQSMGRITGADARFWHFDEAGVQSPRSKEAEFNSPKWRTKYWQNLTASLTTKHEDWKHERERRILLRSGLVVDFGRSKEARKLVYRFEDLEGIVFGGQTPAKDIVKIVRAVREKCIKAGRTKFEFSRADYSPHEGKMILSPLSALKVG